MTAHDSIQPSSARDRRIRRLVTGFLFSLGMSLGLGLSLQMGMGCAYILVSEQRNADFGHVSRTPMGDWILQYGEPLRTVGTFITLGVVGVILLLFLARTVKSAAAMLRTNDPLRIRLDLWTDRAELPRTDWRLWFALTYIVLLVVAVVVVARQGGIEALIDSTPMTIGFVAVSLGFSGAAWFVSRRQRWGERQFRRVEQRLFARHARDLDRRLGPDEKIHELAVAFPAGAAATSSNQPMMVLATSERFIVAQPLLMGTLLALREDIPVRKLSSVRSSPANLITSLFTARPGSGKTGLVTVEKLGGRKSSWRFASEATAEAYAAALTKLRGEDFAGAGALSVSAADEGGDLSIAASEGGLSVDD